MSWATTRLAVLERDAYTCRYCGVRPDPMRYWHEWVKRWISNIHVDHVIPRCKGGTDDMDNLVTACRSCNLVKYDQEWSVP